MKKRRFAALILVLVMALSSLTVNAAAPSIGYTDVNVAGAQKYAANGIAYVSKQRIMNGTVAGVEFAPEKTVTRAEVVATFYNMQNKPGFSGTCPFSDVEQGKWYYEAINWAYSAGIVHGDSNATTYRPNDAVTRQELAAIIRNYAVFVGADTTVSSNDVAGEFTDGADIAAWAKTSVAYVFENNYIVGTDAGKFLPKDNTLRQQLAVILAAIVNDTVFPGGDIEISEGVEQDLNAVIQLDRQFVGAGFTEKHDAVDLTQAGYGFDYSSSNPSVITVSADGKIKAVGTKGQYAYITASAKGLRSSATIKVTITHGTCTRIQYVGSGDQDNVIAFPGNVTWNQTSKVLNAVSKACTVNPAYANSAFYFDTVDNEGIVDYKVIFDSADNRAVFYVKNASNEYELVENPSYPENKTFNNMELRLPTGDFTGFLVDIATAASKNDVDLSGLAFDISGVTFENIIPNNNGYLTVTVDGEVFDFFAYNGKLYAEGDKTASSVATKWSAYNSSFTLEVPGAN